MADCWELEDGTGIWDVSDVTVADLDDLAAPSRRRFPQKPRNSRY